MLVKCKMREIEGVAIKSSAEDANLNTFQDWEVMVHIYIMQKQSTQKKNTGCQIKVQTKNWLHDQICQKRNSVKSLMKPEAGKWDNCSLYVWSVAVNLKRLSCNTLSSSPSQSEMLTAAVWDDAWKLVIILPGRATAQKHRWHTCPLSTRSQNNTLTPKIDGEMHNNVPQSFVKNKDTPKQSGVCRFLEWGHAKCLLR